MKEKPRFLLNTNYQAAGPRVWIHDLRNTLASQGYEAKVNDWDNYRSYDVAIFMPYDSEIQKAKKENPSILVGLVDPKTNDAAQAKKADFLIVSSIEQYDLFLKLNPNLFIFHPLPRMPKLKKVHRSKEKIILGYHGNKVHLHSFYPNLTEALNELGKLYDLELWAVYNLKTFGTWTVGAPDESRVKIRHIQWSEKNINELLSQSDIGLAPALLPIRNENRLKKKAIFSRSAFLNDPNDYLVRYKYSTNPGRIFVFSQLGIPVISGMYPSAHQFIFHGHSGFNAHSPEGWYTAIEQLARDPDLRNLFAENLAGTFDRKSNPDLLAANLVDFVANIKSRSNTPIHIASSRLKSVGFSAALAKEALSSKFKKLRNKIR